METNTLTQPVNPSEIPVQQPIQTPPVNNQKSILPIILGGLFLFVAVGASAYYLGTQNSKVIPQAQNTSPPPTTNPQNAEVINPTNIPVATQIPQTKTSEWNTYNSTKLGFTIDYPKKISKYNENWQYEEFSVGGTNTMVGFGTPSSKSGGYFWGVSLYNDKTIEQLIAEQGKQFSDRKEARKNITVDGKSAILVTVTTNQYPEWVSKTVFLEQGEKVYVIGNGAIEIPEFDNFYNSFKTLN
jgi:hypothetical protein